MLELKVQTNGPSHDFDDKTSDLNTEPNNSVVLKESLISPERESKNKEKFLSFDDLLNDIGFGKYQLKIYFIMACLALAEGGQIMVFTMMIPILEVQWGVQDWLNGLQASLIFVSFLIGSVVSG